MFQAFAINIAIGEKKGKEQDLLPVGLLANLVECYTGIREITGFESGTSLNFSGFPVILLPLCPASMMHKKHQRRKNNSRHESINRSEDVFVEYPVHVISVTDLAAVV